MVIKRIDPPLPLISPKGSCLAHFLIDYGIEHEFYWVCFQDNTGECWTWSNKDIRSQKNMTIGRKSISPFYDPSDVAFEDKQERYEICGTLNISHCSLDESGKFTYKCKNCLEKNRKQI